MTGSVLHAVALLFSIPILWTLYNLYLHPLRRFPGPIAYRASSLPWAFYWATGQLPFRAKAIHDEYGPVVRLSPHHLSFTHAEAWKEIYGHRGPELPKASFISKPIRSLPSSIFTADAAEHQALRRALSQGLSNTALARQETLIAQYVNLLIQRLHEMCSGRETVQDIGAWYNWTAFDIVGHLVFGETFGCLENVRYHPWIPLILQRIRRGAVLSALNYLGLGHLIDMAHRLGAGAQAMKETMELTYEMLYGRLSDPSTRGDIFEGIIQKKEELKLDFDKLAINASILIMAGSETTATTLTGTTFLLLQNRDVLDELVKEIRSTFTDASEITFSSTRKLTLLQAVLNEALRLYPSVSAGQIRRVPFGGARIAGHFVPAETLVEVQQWSINHDHTHWPDPSRFDPKRFLDGARGNKTEALQPFSTGPRDCIGRNLANAEMRLVLARVLYDFDLSLFDGCSDWISRQKSFGVWERLLLSVCLTARAKETWK